MTSPRLTLFAVVQNIGDSLVRPSLASLLSKRTEAGQGATLGLQASFDSLGRIAGPAWGGFVFQTHPTYPYLTGAAIFLAAFAASIFRLVRAPAPGAGEPPGRSVAQDRQHVVPVERGFVAYGIQRTSCAFRRNRV